LPTNPTAPRRTPAATAVAGVDAVKQANWNNLEAATGSLPNLKADNLGAAADTTATVEWTCPNTWSSTGRGEENNGFTVGSPDHTLMIGYLDTGDLTTQATITGLPSQLTSGYDARANARQDQRRRSGDYRVTDPSGTVLRDYTVAMAGQSLDLRQDPGLSHDDRQLRCSAVDRYKYHRSDDERLGLVRAPLAIQLVAASARYHGAFGPGEPATSLDGANIGALGRRTDTGSGLLLRGRARRTAWQDDRTTFETGR
jgi:hypothetical protein